MRDLLTTLTLTVMTLLSLGACGLMIGRLRLREPRPKLRQLQYALVGVTTVLATAVVAYRMVVVYGSWQPLNAHVDGLVMIAGLLSAAVLFLQSGRRLPEFSGFALPVVTLMLAWSICASWWTNQPFKVQSIWMTFHLATVYLGFGAVAVAAAAGSMYLYVQHRLRNKGDLPAFGRFASLEGLERVLVAGSTFGFAAITLGLLSGLVVQTQEPGVLGDGWWYSPKIVISTVAWLIYALLMNVRYTTHFRGSRAAWLSIAGLVLLLVTFALATSMPGGAG